MSSYSINLVMGTLLGFLVKLALVMAAIPIALALIAAALPLIALIIIAGTAITCGYGILRAIGRKP
jgi:hypothetical protein